MDNLYSKRPNLILGFHGCDKSVAEKVINGDCLKESTNDYDWLGHGIYFWQNSPERAMEYARTAKKRKKSTIKEPAVVGAIIDLGNCLDLLEMNHIQVVKSAYNVFGNIDEEDRPKNERIQDGFPMLRKLDRAVIEMVHQKRKDKEHLLIEVENLLRTISLLIKLNDKEKYKSIIVDCFLKLLNIYNNKDLIELFGLKLLTDLFDFIKNGGEKETIIKEIDDIANQLRTLVTKLAPYDSVRSFFLEGSELYPDAGFREKNHIQICVCNKNCIKGFFMPREMDDNHPNP
ncbi:hypothetical protein NG821_11965 [Prevotella cerevisiae]|jgi:hypothetical protein|uniref:DUF3990 domain-containing protein n=1 Tax=Segatella cerevisiae TaxID=2053716 RepID=A0ABT1C0Q0_9BACT|nr:hypothetical protein [Segatella cerevisiae]MCO6026540.1 hypothetical protein [Segatella cerevisiae]